MIVYKYTHKVSGKCYVGQTAKTLHERHIQHLKYDDYYFQRALRKYGEDAFTCEVIAEADTREELNTLEVKFVALYHSNEREFGYNLSPGGNYRGISEEGRLKIIQANLGKNRK